MASSSSRAQPAPQSRVALGLAGTASSDGRGDVLGWVAADPAIPAGAKAAIGRLGEGGADLATLRSLCLARDGMAGLPALDMALEQLCAGGMVSATEHGADGGALVTVAPLPAALLETDDAAAIFEPAGRYSLSAYAAVRPDKDGWRIEGPHAATTVVTHDPAVFALLADLARERSGAELRLLAERAPSRLLLPALAAGGLLRAEGGDDPAAEAPWDFHDALFHARSQLGRQATAYGGTYRGRGVTPAPPAVMSVDYATRVPLPSPDLARIRDADPPFGRVLEDRRSIRDFGATPMDVAALGEFLFRTCRTKAVSDDGEWQTALRPSPGGGAVHELEVYPLVRDCPGVELGLHYYHPRDHTLCRVRSPDGLTGRMLQAAWHTIGRAGLPPVVLFVTARFDRAFWKYEAMAYALVLKDVGALYQTLSLTAAAMGLAGCPLGGGDADLFARVSGRPYWREGAVGGFVLGSRAEGRAP